MTTTGTVVVTTAAVVLIALEVKAWWQWRKIPDEQLPPLLRGTTQKKLTPMLVRFVPSALVTCVVWVHMYKQIYPYLSERVGEDVASGLADWLTTAAAALAGYITYHFISKCMKPLRRNDKSAKGSRAKEQ